MQKKNKQYEQFQYKIKEILKDFQRNREWADIGNWLSRLQPIISSHKFPDFPHKINMAKRLAQCLNISLPAGVHSGALGVYNIILSNYGEKHTMLPLLSIGLFPFFQYSSSSLKLQIISLFDKHFINDHQCVQMIVSLMNTLLTGLNENNEELAKKIYSLCDKISKSYGRTWVDGAVWVNILKSPKVRVAGFKYFMKSFKDRDKQLKNQAQMEEQQKMEQQQIKFIQNQQMLCDELSGVSDGEREMIITLIKMKEREDDYQTRFPNFSSLVVNALSACMDIAQPDNFARRAALDLMIFHLKLGTEFMSELDTIQLLTVMLQILKLKQYSLTRRIYTYLFGQPNMEGNYTIDEKQRSFQIRLLLKSLENLLRVETEVSNHQSILLILDILLKDHESLEDIIIPPLAYKTLTFLRKCSLHKKIINEFYHKIMKQKSEVFISACLKQLLKDQQINNRDEASEAISTIQYFYLLNVYSETDQFTDMEIIRTIEGLLKYLELNQCVDDKNSEDILDLCFKLLKSANKPSSCFGQQSIKTLNYLISLKPKNSIYGGLLNLHPCPSKQSLLPYINETSLSIVCISNLLNISPQKMESDEINDIYFAIFKMLNCHLWEDHAIQFIEKYKILYPKYFEENINIVEPTEWLIYWKKMNGGFHDGVIRMLRNLNDENPLLKNISKKWIEGSKLIITKIVDPIYAEIKHYQIEDNKQGRNRVPLDDLFKMLENVFLILKDEFVTFFFVQQEKYLLPLTNCIYKILEGQDTNLKTHSLLLLQFILERANSPQQKMKFLKLTLEKALKVLQDTFSLDEYLREIEILSFLKGVADIFSSFNQVKDKAEQLQKFIDEKQFFAILSEGMKETKVGYVRTLYMQLLQFSLESLAPLSDEKQMIAKNLTITFERLFLMLRQNDVTYLEQIIRGKITSSTSTNRRKKSTDVMATFLEMNTQIFDTAFNVQSRYAQAIQLWNMVKFMVKICIENKIHDLPITQLLSLILQSFPFSYLKYNQISTGIMAQQYQSLQEQIRNMTGLKKQVLEIFETLWQNYHEQIINYLIQKGDPRVLIHSNLDPNAVIKAILHTKSYKTITKYHKPSNFNIPKSYMHYNTDILMQENQICYFFYLYMMYCNLSLIKHKKHTHFISHLLSLTKAIKESCHVQTKLWLIQILYCVSLRIPFREIHGQITKIRQQFQDLLKNVFDQLRHVAIRTKSLTQKTEIKTGIFNIFSKQEEQKSQGFDFIKIYPPTIHMMNQKYSKKAKNKNAEHLLHIDDEMQYFLFSKSIGQKTSSFIEYLSIVSMKTLTRVYTKLLIFFYDMDITKIAPIIKDHLMSMFPLFSDKSEKNQHFIENVTEFLFQILNTPALKSDVIKNCRRQIIDLFQADDFFKCTKKTLKNWKFIIDVCSESQDLLGELLTQKLFEGLFQRKAEQTRQKIKTFERLCFLIYAGRLDKYENKLRTVLESLIEVMKQENPSPALLILILFCIRILLIRLSENTLNRIFRSIWPSLIALLIQIFTKKAFEKNNNLLLAGLKVIELVHALELQEFNIHKWIFIFDYFGIRLETMTEQQQKQNNSDSMMSPFTFKPILSTALPENNLKCNFVPRQWNDSRSQVQVCKRKLVVKESNIDNDEQLRNHAFVLLQYMMDLNQKRVYTVKEQIEDLIEADFISLDDYIFQLK